ncbi:decapping mRNA 1 [Leptinotarsa decemlineata]|uniref:decapping mRNA 1 n=1 Tax=Leptinotarsa decemlineata TaxID=7539 RepID=UPI003D30C208
MADSVELRMSVTSIKRVDPYVKDILANATHVALYIFNISTNAWEKTETEGALFIYSRNGEPFHSIMVMNRLNTDNLIEPIVKDFDYQMQVPFLLYRNSKSKIFGIWFFNKEECVRITCMIESLMEGLKDRNDEKSKKIDGNVDIFSMLTKAQETFNRTPVKQEGPTTYSSTPRVPDVTSQSVMDFFAKASTKTSQKPSVSGSSGENVLQRLMSNPANTVEHIEKQQRSITPQDHLNVRQKVTTNADRRSVPITFPGSSSNDINFSSENGLNLNTHSVSQNQNQLKAASPLTHLLHNQNRSDKEDTNDLLGTSSFAQFLDTQKPHLMTPMMFTNPTAKENLNDSTEEKLEQMDLLTEKQLAQALIYLLKNNSDFTRQIHEAYVKSIMERVNLNSNSLI